MTRRKNTAAKTQGVKTRDVNAAVRAIAALDLALAGHDWQTIAEQSGYASPGAAHNAVQRELKRRIDPRVDALRELQLARLGRLRTVYYPKAMAGDGWSMDRVLRIDERESALMGLDAAKAPTEEPNVYTVVQEVYPAAWVDALAMLTPVTAPAPAAPAAEQQQQTQPTPAESVSGAS